MIKINPKRPICADFQIISYKNIVEYCQIWYNYDYKIVMSIILY